MKILIVEDENYVAEMIRRALEELRWMAPDGIVNIIRNEHPQVIAVVMQTLDSGLAARIASSNWSVATTLF